VDGRDKPGHDDGKGSRQHLLSSDAIAQNTVLANAFDSPRFKASMD
jgi:hypothetical protein